MDPVRRSILTERFEAIPEEMGHVLRRSAYSPNIKERMDASCAIFDAKGRMLAQAEHIPVHLGSMPLALKAVMDGFEGELHENDQVILNDPYHGGTHLPDITLIMPVFYDDELLGFCANRAHHADVGADEPGSLPPYSMYLDEEGVVIPPYFLVRDGQLNEKLVTTVQEEMRNPRERLGDLRAQIGANRRGKANLVHLIDELRPPDFRTACRDLREYSSRLVRYSISKIRDGTYEAEEWLESTGTGDEPAKITCSVKILGNSIEIDFSGTDPQVRGNANAPLAVTISSCYYVIRCLTDQEAPLNEGCYDMIEINAPSGTLVHPTEPHAVCSGNVETSQRIVDVLFEAFRKAIPEQIPAQSQGTMNNFIIGVEGEEEHKTYYETIGGGEGAFSNRDGQDGIHTHMTNTKNTPIESVEHEYPLRIVRYQLRSGSGGAGDHVGGEGIIREIEFLGDHGTVSLITERRKRAPKGAGSGEDGKPGKNWYIPINGSQQPLGPRHSGVLEHGDRIRIETPGGGGYGS